MWAETILRKGRGEGAAFPTELFFCPSWDGTRGYSTTHDGQKSMFLEGLHASKPPACISPIKKSVPAFLICTCNTTCILWYNLWNATGLLEYYAVWVVLSINRREREWVDTAAYARIYYRANNDLTNVVRLWFG